MSKSLVDDFVIYLKNVIFSNNLNMYHIASTEATLREKDINLIYTL